MHYKERSIAPFFAPAALSYAGFCNRQGAIPASDDHLSVTAVTRTPRLLHAALRRSMTGDGTIADSPCPIPPCITMSLPTGKPVLGSRGVSVPSLGRESSLWHWSYAAFTEYMTTRRALPAWRSGDARTFLPATSVRGDHRKSGNAKYSCSYRQMQARRWFFLLITLHSPPQAAVAQW